jgi:hypothetical protein
LQKRLNKMKRDSMESRQKENLELNCVC